MSSLLQLEPGRTFARDYRVVRPLDEGGMGAVYVVEQLSTGTQRALKLMHPDLVGDPRSRARFEQEAKVGARIESDHVVQVLAAGVDDETALPWLVMELLKGETLASAVERRGFLPGEEILEIYRQACHALGLAHAAGLVHRDLKPENIFLAAPRRVGVPVTVKILDFGIAKVIEESQRSGGVGANATQMLGSPLYMAPEQAQAGPIGPHTDVWAMGLVAFFAWTGRAYWRSANSSDATVQSLLAELLVQPIDPPTVRAAALGVGGLIPQGFDPWFARCVVREPSARFRDAADLVASLEAAVRSSVGGMAAPGTASGSPWNAPTPAPGVVPATHAPSAVARTGEIPPPGSWTGPPPQSSPFGAQQPSAFGAQPSMPGGFNPPPSQFGAPPTQPPYGSQPSAPGAFAPGPTGAANFGAQQPTGAGGFAPVGSQYGSVGGYAAPPPARSNTGMIVGIGLLGVVLLGGAGFAIANLVTHHAHETPPHEITPTPPGTLPPGTLPPGTLPPGMLPTGTPPPNGGKLPSNGLAMPPTPPVADIPLPVDPTVTRTLNVRSDTGGAITDHNVTGANAVVTDACTIGWLALDLAGNHTFAGDLDVQLRNPRGVVEPLQSHQTSSPFHRFLVQNFEGQSAAGTWTIKVEDTADADTGSLDGFTLTVGCR